MSGIRGIDSPGPLIPEQEPEPASQNSSANQIPTGISGITDSIESGEGMMNIFEGLTFNAGSTEIPNNPDDNVSQTDQHLQDKEKIHDLLGKLDDIRNNGENGPDVPDPHLVNQGDNSADALIPQLLKQEDGGPVAADEQQPLNQDNYSDGPEHPIIVK